MTLTERLRLARPWIVLVIALALLGAAIAAIVAISAPPRYTSQVSALVGPPLGGEINNNDISVGQSLRQTFADLAVTRPVLEKVLQTTGVDATTSELVGAITTRVPVNSSLLDILVEWDNPDDAAKLANGVADQLVQDLEAANPNGNSNVTIRVVDPAVPPTRRDNAGPLSSAALGAGVGVVLAICVAFLVENLRSTRPREVA